MLREEAFQDSRGREAEGCRRRGSRHVARPSGDARHPTEQGRSQLPSGRLPVLRQKAIEVIGNEVGVYTVPCGLRRWGLAGGVGMSLEVVGREGSTEGEGLDEGAEIEVTLISTRIIMRQICHLLLSTLTSTCLDLFSR